MTISGKIRILLGKRGNMSEAELARRVGQSAQNFNSKMQRNSFIDAELHKIAAALDCTFEMSFQLNDTGEKV
jgi:DNA-binding Xre family transcriptional regulator